MSRKITSISPNFVRSICGLFIFPRKSIVAGAFLFCAIIASAQSAQEIQDSVLMVLKTYKTKDTTYCNLLGMLIEAESDRDKRLVYSAEIRAIAVQNMPSSSPTTKIGRFWLSCLSYDEYNIGSFHYTKADFGKATTAYFKSLKYAEQANDVNLQSTILSDLSNIYMELGDIEKGIDNYRKILAIEKKRKDWESIGMIYRNMGIAFQHNNQLDSAGHYIKKALEIHIKLKNSSDIAHDYNSLAVIFQKQKNYTKALSYATLASQQGDLMDDVKADIAFTKGIIYRRLNRADSAIYFHQKAFDAFSKLEKKHQLRTVSLSLARVYEVEKDYENAYKWLDKSVAYQDSLQEDKSKEILLKAEFKHENEKKQAEIQRLAQENRIKSLQMWILLGGIFTLIAISYVLFARFKTKKQNELLKVELLEAQKTAEAERKANESELKALKSQMNPHFIFNALNSIQEQFMYGDKLKANEQMSNFTYLTRKILEVSGKKQITIATEVEILEKYLSLEKMRFGDEFNFSITTSDKIDEDYHQILPMLLQPLVENSAKHGLLHKHGQKHVSVHFDLDEQEENLRCTVTDNGIGRQKSAAINAKNLNKHQSFSTNSIHERLAILDSKTTQFLTEDVLNEANEVVGTRCIVQIPVL